MASEINNFDIDESFRYLYILDSTYTSKLIIDTFTDFLWVERYYGYGEFEITVPIDINIIQNCRINDYVSIKESDTVMIVETIGVHTDPENGDTMTISGRSLESLLERRVLLDALIGSKDSAGNLQDISVQVAIKTITNNNIISPSDQKRKISNFIFTDSEDSAVVGLTMTSFEERGANVYDKIVDICRNNEIGFKVSASEIGGFDFKLYAGIDRSWDQDIIPPVVFSDSYENLSNSDYLQSEINYKSTVYVEWSYEIEGYKKKDMLTEVYRSPERIGLARRESYTKNENTSELTSEENVSSYIKGVVNSGTEYLANYKVTKMFEGETNPYRQFVYGVDYMLGDIVQLENKYGYSGKCRITEIIRSRDASGYNMTPTFELIEDEGDD